MSMLISQQLSHVHNLIYILMKLQRIPKMSLPGLQTATLLAHRHICFSTSCQWSLTQSFIYKSLTTAAVAAAVAAVTLDLSKCVNYYVKVVEVASEQQLEQATATTIPSHLNRHRRQT